SQPRRAADTVCHHSTGNRLLMRFPQHLSGGSTSPVLAGPSAGSARRRSLSAPAARPPRSAPAGPTPVGGEKLEHRSNPVLDADWPDPDVIRVGDDYWMIASSFHRAPGLPVLRSRALVTSEPATNALPALVPEEHYSLPRRGSGVWAPSIREHAGTFHIVYPDPDQGIVVLATPPCSAGAARCGPPASACTPGRSISSIRVRSTASSCSSRRIRPVRGARRGCCFPGGASSTRARCGTRTAAPTWCTAGPAPAPG